LVLKIKEVVRYQEDAGKNNFNIRQTFTRERFKETEQKIDISALKLHRTDESEFKGAYQMMNLKQLKESQSINKRQIDSSSNTNFKLLNVYLKYFSMPKKPKEGTKFLPTKANYFDSLKVYEKVNLINNAQSEARSIHELLKGRVDRDNELFKEVQRAALEYQKKFTLSVACLALFLIGAPLGAIIRKGGLGLPVVISVIFFLLYYIISTIGEKYVKDGGLSPIIGSWIAIIIITPIGIFLSYKAATDSVIFDFDSYKRFFKNSLKWLPKRS
jgi:lipopolysaccharide export system permease protein